MSYIYSVKLYSVLTNKPNNNNSSNKNNNNNYNNNK